MQESDKPDPFRVLAAIDGVHNRADYEVLTGLWKRWVFLETERKNLYTKIK